MSVILSIIGSLVSIFILWNTEWIKNHFNKKVIKYQSEYKNELQESKNKFLIELEIHKDNFLLELEKKKLNFDIRRSTEIEINKNRILFYEYLISDLFEKYILFCSYNKNFPFSGDIEEKINISGFEYLKKVSEKSFYLSNPETQKVYGEISLIVLPLMSHIVINEKIPEDELQKFNKLINKLRNQMMIELTKEEN